MIFKKIGNMENVEVICHYFICDRKRFFTTSLGKSSAPSSLKAMESRPLQPLRIIWRDIDDNSCLAVP